MKLLLGVGMAALFSLAGCGNTHHLLAPDPGARLISSEKPAGDCKSCVDPVCGGKGCFQAGGWRSSHRGINYGFDSEACKASFDADPDVYSAR